MKSKGARRCRAVTRRAENYHEPLIILRPTTYDDRRRAVKISELPMRTDASIY